MYLRGGSGVDSGILGGISAKDTIRIARDLRSNNS